VSSSVDCLVLTLEIHSSDLSVDAWIGLNDSSKKPALLLECLIFDDDNIAHMKVVGRTSILRAGL